MIGEVVSCARANPHGPKTVNVFLFIDFLNFCLWVNAKVKAILLLRGQGRPRPGQAKAKPGQAKAGPGQARAKPGPGAKAGAKPKPGQGQAGGV